MLHLLSDENFNGDIVRGLFLRHPDLDLCRVQDTGLEAAGSGHFSEGGGEQPYRLDA